MDKREHRKNQKSGKKKIEAINKAFEQNPPHSSK